MSAQDPQFAPGPHGPRHGRRTHAADPLRRRSDRVEAWVSRLVLLLLVIGLPVAAVSVGLAVYSSQMRVVHTESAERHQVTARLTEDAAGPLMVSDGDDFQRAPVRWTEEDGAQRAGTARVPPGTEAGETVRVWVSHDGAVARAPLSPGTAAANGWLAGGVTAGGVAAAVLAAQTGVRHVLDRRRYAQWDAEWQVVEPRWSARFRQ
jgi:hypothetical protein